jgi:tetratricopeptide (TPR) repeat protein
VVSTFDRSHHAAGGLAATLAAALTPLRLLDSANALVLLVPLAPLAPLLFALGPRLSPRAWALAAALVLPPLALLLVVQPQHELPRDWDVFAFAGSALAVLLAWRVADLLGARPAARGLALPLALATAIPAIEWVALQSRPENAWTRAESILAGPPARRASEIADGLGTIGVMRLGRGQFQHALELFERSAEQAPNPRMFVQIGMAETMLGHPDRAMARYRHAASLNPDLHAAWRGIAAAASALGDRTSMREAVANLERLEPDGETLRDARAWLEANPGP